MARSRRNVPQPKEHSALSIDNVSKSYGTAPALDPISFDINTGIVRSVGAAQQLGVDRVGRVVLHRQSRGTVEQMAGAGEEQLQVIVQLGHGPDGGAAGAHRVSLVDSDGWRHAVHPVYGGLVHAVQKLARIGREGFHIAALAFGVERVKHQTGLARTAGTGDDRQLAGTDVQIQVLQVVLPCAADADRAMGHRGVLKRGGQTF